MTASVIRHSMKKDVGEEHEEGRKKEREGERAEGGVGGSTVMASVIRHSMKKDVGVEHEEGRKKEWVGGREEERERGRESERGGGGGGGVTVMASVIRHSMKKRCGCGT